MRRNGPLPSREITFETAKRTQQWNEDLASLAYHAELKDFNSLNVAATFLSQRFADRPTREIRDRASQDLLLSDKYEPTAGKRVAALPVLSGDAQRHFASWAAAHFLDDGPMGSAAKNSPLWDKARAEIISETEKRKAQRGEAENYVDPL